MNRHETLNSPLIQAYRQAPWRNQLQWIVFFLLGLVLLAVVAAVYLSVSAASAQTGRDIQAMEMDSTDIENQIADLNTQLAMLTSAAQMQKRAKDMGFVSTDPSKQTFLMIPVYSGRQPAIMAPPPSPASVPTTLIKPSYTQSLWEWMFQGFLTNPAIYSLPKS